MPESPDFDRIARQLDVDLADTPAGLGDRFLAARLDVIKATLRQVWNARGAADIATIAALDIVEHGDAYVRILDRALRALDR